MDLAKLGMKISLVHVTISIFGLLSGTVIPIFVSEIMGAVHVNVIWAPLYGLGFFLWETAFGFPAFGNVGLLYALFGMVVWPLAMCVAVALGISALRDHLSRRKFAAMILVVLASYFIYVPLKYFPILPYFSQYIQ